MKVAHLIHGLGLGGAQQVIKLLIAERSAGFEHRVISCHGGVFAAQIAAAGGTVEILPRRLPKLDPFWALAMARAFRRARIDVVHGHLFGDTFHGYFACRLAGLLPMVMTLHNSTDARTPLQLRGYRFLLGARTLPVACAEFVRESFVETAGKVAGRIRTIANGIAERPPAAPVPELRRRLRELGGFPEDAVILATLGRLTAQKAQGDLLAALFRLPRDSPWRLVVFGDGELRPALESQAAALGLADRICFAGFRADAADFLPACDALIFSSLFEGLPIALLEGLAAGCPVVATRVGGIPGVIDDGVEGLLVPPRDPAALALALGKVAGDPAQRAAFGRAGRARFERQLRARAMVDRYEALYREAAAARRADPIPAA